MIIKKELFQDIAVLTKATFVSKDLNINAQHLGKIHKAIIKKDNTALISSHKTQQLEDRIKEIESQINNNNNEYELKNLKERLDKLSGGIAVIEVGDITKTELKEKKLRIEEALNATQAAITEGIVVGVGKALVEIYQELKDKLVDSNVDVQKGINIVLESLFGSYLSNSKNAGFDVKEGV